MNNSTTRLRWTPRPGDWMAGMALAASLAAGPVHAATGRNDCASVDAAPRAANQLVIGTNRILLADASLPNDRLREALRSSGATGAIRLLADARPPAAAGSAPSAAPPGVLDAVVARVPGSSALFSFPGEDVRYSSLQANGANVQIVARVLGTRVLPLAAVVSQGQRTTDLVWFAPGSSGGPTAQLQALERLYHLAFQQTPDQFFQVRRHDEAAPQARSRGASQGDALRMIARARACALTAYEGAVSGSPLRRWELVRMQFVGTMKPSETTVAVRVTDARGRPVPTGSVTVARGPHLACAGSIDATGSARCKLFDVHGDHDEDGDEDAAAPTIATFSGSIGEDRILPPTTGMAAAAGRTTKRAR